MWTTTIKSRIITNGLLSVVVEFSDGTQTFTDRYETRSAQDANWLNDNITRKIADLDGVVAFANTITLGVFTPTEPIVIEPPTEGKALYEYRLNLLEKMVSAIRKGLITDQNAQFISLKTWLKNNFQEDYIDLF